VVTCYTDQHQKNQLQTMWYTAATVRGTLMGQLMQPDLAPEHSSFIDATVAAQGLCTQAGGTYNTDKTAFHLMARPLPTRLQKPRSQEEGGLVTLPLAAAQPLHGPSPRVAANINQIEFTTPAIQHQPTCQHALCKDALKMLVGLVVLRLAGQRSGTNCCNQQHRQ
jgi:hypothetical protein